MTWTTISYPPGATEIDAVAADGTLVYLVDNTPALNSYDPALDSFTGLAVTPITSTNEGALNFVADDGGDPTLIWFDPTPATYAYNITTDTWSGALAPDPFGSRSFYASGWIAGPTTGGRIVVAGGYGPFSVATADVRIYDVDTDTWSAGAPMPAALAECQGAFSGGLFYVFGGADGSYIPTGYVYNPASDSWAVLGALAFDANSAGWPAVVALPGGDLFVVGGFGVTPSSAAWYYHHPTNTWTAETAVPFADYMRGVTIGDTVYAWDVYDGVSAASLVTAPPTPPPAPTPPPSLRASYFATLADFPGGPSTEIAVSDSRSVEAHCRDAGQGTLVHQNDAPDQPSLGGILAWDIYDWELLAYVRAFASLVQTRGRVRIAEGEEKDEKTTVSGPGHLAVTAKGRIDPPGGVERIPVVETIAYNYTHPGYDDSAAPWVGANVLMSVLSAQAVLSGGAGLWPLPWSKDMPNGNIIGPTGSTPVSAPAGLWYGREDFTTTYDGKHLLFCTADNAATIYIDGKLIASIGSTGNITTSGFQQLTTVPVDLSAGTHTVAFEVLNYSPSGANPSGIAAQIYSLDTFPPTLQWGVSGTTKINDYPGDVPGMTVGTVIRLALAPHVAVPRAWAVAIVLDFDDVNDSNGVPWPYFANITATVGVDTVLSLIEKLQAVNADIWMDPNGWTLHAYDFETFSPASGVTWAPEDDLTHLEYNQEEASAKELLIRSDALGWSKAGSGEEQNYVTLGSEIAGSEVARIATSLIGRFGTDRTEIQLAYHPGFVSARTPWLNGAFVPGCLATAPDDDDTPVEERVLVIGVSESSRELLMVTVSLKDRIAELDERLVQEVTK